MRKVIQPHLFQADNRGSAALSSITLVFAELSGMGPNLLIQAQQDAANAKPT